MMQAQDFPLISHSPKRWAEFLRTRTPILESIVPLRGNSRRDWNALGIDSLVAHAKWKMSDMGITRKTELEGADRRLYNALQRRAQEVPGSIG